MSAFVLAGGASSRMGRDKALLEIGGKLLIEHAVNLLRKLGGEPRIVAARPDLAKYAPVIEDRRSGCGPLSGIAAGLLASESELATFIPVDVPLLPLALLALLRERSQVSGALATIPCLLGQAQPLCAVYHRRVLPQVSAALEAEDYKVTRVMRQAVEKNSGSMDIFDVETVFTSRGDFRGWPIVLSRATGNCNTPEDLARIQHWTRTVASA